VLDYHVDASAAQRFGARVRSALSRPLMRSVDTHRAAAAAQERGGSEAAVLVIAIGTSDIPH